MKEKKTENKDRNLPNCAHDFFTLLFFFPPYQHKLLSHSHLNRIFRRASAIQAVECMYVYIRLVNV